jgi:dTDP-4-amino-4,6-dideoxygalactose transaminase
MQVPLLDLGLQFSTIKDEVNEAIKNVIESQKFILGGSVFELEKQIAEYCHCRYAIGVSSGTDALLVSLMALGIGPEDEIVVPTYTFFATAGSVSRLGAKPVFIDIEPETYTIDPCLIEKNITRKTRAIIPVHLYGQCAEMEPILQIAKKYNLKVIEDVAQAIGSEYEGKRAGSMGDTGCFSFFPSKNLGGIGEGGMVTTNNEEIAQIIRTLRVHGSKPKYYHKIIGGNFRLDTIQAAVLIVKLKYLDVWTKKRQENANLYDKLFLEVGLTDRIGLPVARQSRHVFNQYVIKVKHRDRIQTHLKEKGIGTEVYYPVPLHLQECFRELMYKQDDCPVAEDAAKTTLALPIYPELTEQQQRYVVQQLADIFKGLI